MALSRKHYVEIAEILGHAAARTDEDPHAADSQIVADIVHDLSLFLKRDNSAFDTTRFLDAVASTENSDRSKYVRNH